MMLQKNFFAIRDIFIQVWDYFSINSVSKNNNLKSSIPRCKIQLALIEEIGIEKNVRKAV